MSTRSKNGFASKVLEWLFPSRAACCSCGAEAVLDEHGLCIDCHLGIELFNAAPPLNYIDGYNAAYVYNDVSSAMVKKLKYNNCKYIAKELADALELKHGWRIDAVTPVPLHYRREAKRGYNQSLLIAKHLCKRLGLKLDTSLLVRSRDTRQQARSTGAQRRRNLKDAFIADDSCRGLSVLLVDDVRTTGATLSECAKALKKCGCDKVYAVTACFTAPDSKGEYNDNI